MKLLVSCLLLLCLIPVPSVFASVELSWSGQPPKTIAEVYHYQGVVYLALDDVLSALDLHGDWSSVDHLYRIRTPQGKASLFPGGHYLHLGDRFIPLQHPPRFLDGRLRVSEEFVLVQLPLLTGKSVYFRNLDPQVPQTADDSPLDRLFAFLLQKKQASSSGLRGVAIDVGHGGDDPGCIGLQGVREKDVVMQVARRLERLIKMRLGIPVYLSRDGDYSLTRQQRLKTAARDDVDVFLLLHAQSSFSPQAQGVTLFVRPGGQTADGQAEDQDSMRLALACQQVFSDHKIPVDKIRQVGLLPLGRGNLPTLLVELGYLNNEADRQRLTSSEGQNQLAEALLDGLQQFSKEQENQHQ